MSSSESIADVLELLSERVRDWKERVRSLERDLSDERQNLAQFVSEISQTKRVLAQSKHQRDMARLALTDIHATLAPLREEADEGAIDCYKGAEAVGSCLKHVTRGLTLSAQYDQPEARR